MEHASYWPVNIDMDAARQAAGDGVLIAEMNDEVFVEGEDLSGIRAYALAQGWVCSSTLPMLHRYLCDADRSRPVQTVAYDRCPVETLYKAVVVDDADAVLRCAFYGSGEYTVDNGVVSIKAGAVPCVVESYADAAILWYGEDGNVVARKGMEGKGLAVNAGTVPVDAGEVVKDIVKRWSP